MANSVLQTLARIRISSGRCGVVKQRFPLKSAPANDYSGGGGTFGVVIESTTLVSPVVTVQAILLSITSPSANLTQELYSIMIENGLKWADEGYGGYVSGGTAVYLTPKLTAAEHAASMAPLLDFGRKLNATGAGVYQLLEFPNWLSFFNVFTETELEAQGPPVGYSIAMASRLVTRANFQTKSARSELLEALLAATALTPTLLFDITAPSSFPGDNTTSISPVWRDAIYHVTVKVPWNWNATTQEKLGGYNLVNTSINYLRAITPVASYSVRPTSTLFVWLQFLIFIVERRGSS